MDTVNFYHPVRKHLFRFFWKSFDLWRAPYQLNTQDIIDALGRLSCDGD